MMEHNEYYNWLLNIIGGPRKYSYMLYDLWTTEFYSVIPNDDNRAADGIELRYYYEEESGDICTKGGVCTVLEMLIAFAQRIDNEYTYDQNGKNKTGQWFWKMAKNIGFCDFPDDKYDHEELKDTIFNFLDRNYDQNGHFCPFMAKNFSQKWAEKELWWQVNRYILDDFSK